MQELTSPALQYFLDLLGIFGGALSGAYLSVRKDFNLFGTLVLAEAAGLGGSLIRDLILDVPPIAFTDPGYPLAPLAAAYIAYRGRALQQQPYVFEVLDAVGLGLFSVTGTIKGLVNGMNVVPSTALGVISAMGGGILANTMARELPPLLCWDSDLYAFLDHRCGSDCRTTSDGDTNHNYGNLRGTGSVHLPPDGCALPLAPDSLGRLADFANATVSRHGRRCSSDAPITHGLRKRHVPEECSPRTWPEKKARPPDRLRRHNGGPAAPFRPGSDMGFRRAAALCHGSVAARHARQCKNSQATPCEIVEFGLISDPYRARWLSTGQLCL